MFTGLIAALGIVKNVTASQLSIEMNPLFEDIHIGDSIAVNGVCLTATKIEGAIFTVDIAPKTRELTTVKWLKVGHKVNLEQAMRANGRFDGHLVQGHVDTVAQIVKIRSLPTATILELKLVDPSYERYIIKQGSIALDGISLTVSDTHFPTIQVNIIPHTFQHTHLVDKKIHDYLNVELDVIAKYVERLFTKSEGLSYEKLQKFGF